MQPRRLQYNSLVFSFYSFFLCIIFLLGVPLRSHSHYVPNRAALHMCIWICFLMPLDHSLVMMVTQGKHVFPYKADDKPIKATSILQIKFSFFRDKIFVCRSL